MNESICMDADSSLDDYALSNDTAKNASHKACKNGANC